MTDVTAGQSIGGFRLPVIGSLNELSKRGDIALAVGVITILVVLILPLPPMLLDFALAISIIFSVLILMTALFIQTPLEFSVFPTVLLIATMLRLALNLASTRLILSHGHEGTAAAGHVIEAFGNFVMGGNFVIGIIVFTILVIQGAWAAARAKSRGYGPNGRLFGHQGSDWGNTHWPLGGRWRVLLATG